MVYLEHRDKEVKCDFNMYEWFEAVNAWHAFRHAFIHIHCFDNSGRWHPFVPFFRTTILIQDSPTRLCTSWSRLVTTDCADTLFIFGFIIDTLVYVQLSIL
jgi:hypothetical protein